MMKCERGRPDLGRRIRKFAIGVDASDACEDKEQGNGA